MTRLDASDLAQRLGREAEAVCRHYLDAGHRQGNYWQVGDARNTPGRSMFVRLKETAKGPAGKWTDAATGEHGDLLDVIRESCGLTDFADVVEEARSFLSLPRPKPAPASLLSDVARGLRRDHRDVAAERPSRLGDREDDLVGVEAVEVAELGGGEGRGDIASTGDRPPDDQPLPVEKGQRLAHRRRTEAQVAGQVIDDQRLARQHRA